MADLIEDFDEGTAAGRRPSPTHQQQMDRLVQFPIEWMHPCSIPTTGTTATWALRHRGGLQRIEQWNGRDGRREDHQLSGAPLGMREEHIALAADPMRRIEAVVSGLYTASATALDALAVQQAGMQHRQQIPFPPNAFLVVVAVSVCNRHVAPVDAVEPIVNVLLEDSAIQGAMCQTIRAPLRACSSSRCCASCCGFGCDIAWVCDSRKRSLLAASDCWPALATSV